MKLIRGVNRGLLKFLDVISIILMIGMVLFLFIQLVARSVFTHGFPWTEELAKICMIMLAYIGAATTSINGVHVNVTILSDALKGVAAKVVYVVQQLIAMFFVALIFIYSYPAMQTAAKSVTTNTQINYAIIYAIIPISCVLMFFGHLAKIITQLVSKEYVQIKDEDRQEAALDEPTEETGEEDNK